jgi:hypothetical protein
VNQRIARFAATMSSRHIRDAANGRSRVARFS